MSTETLGLERDEEEGVVASRGVENKGINGFGGTRSRLFTSFDFVKIAAS